jgi:hypothetical protein
MNWYYAEPTLGEILSDSIIGAVMAADGVDRHQLEATLRRAGVILSTAQEGWRRPPEGCRRPAD